MSTPLQHTSFGELGYSPLTTTSIGELALAFIAIDVRRGGSSGESHQVILARIKREDEEILAIIMSSVDLLE